MRRRDGHEDKVESSSARSESEMRGRDDGRRNDSREVSRAASRAVCGSCERKSGGGFCSIDVSRRLRLELGQLRTLATLSSAKAAQSADSTSFPFPFPVVPSSFAPTIHLCLSATSAFASSLASFVRLNSRLLSSLRIAARTSFASRASTGTKIPSWFSLVAARVEGRVRDGKGGSVDESDLSAPASDSYDCEESDCRARRTASERRKFDLATGEFVRVGPFVPPRPLPPVATARPPILRSSLLIHTDSSPLIPLELQ